MDILLIWEPIQVGACCFKHIWTTLDCQNILILDVYKLTSRKNHHGVIQRWPNTPMMMKAPKLSVRNHHHSPSLTLRVEYSLHTFIQLLWKLKSPFCPLNSGAFSNNNTINMDYTKKTIQFHETLLIWKENVLVLVSPSLKHKQSNSLEWLCQAEVCKQTSLTRASDWLTKSVLSTNHIIAPTCLAIF